MNNIKKKLGFGCMRLPMSDGKINYAEFSKMIDTFLENGFNYFDTSKVYHSGESEIALRECLVKRHPRESFIFTDKLTSTCFNSESEIRPLFAKQLEDCGLTYFDFYLMHAQNASIFEKYKKCRAYETAIELKNEGKIRHLGISFHDTAEVLDRILTEYPEVEVVQIQFNYADYDDPSVQSRKCYEVCRKHNKPIIVMEPVKGGNLVNLPEEAKKTLISLGKGSIASYAIRFAASFEGMIMVLSGMSNLEQMNDNISYMKDFTPLTPVEFSAVKRASDIFHSKELISCTACRYCIDGCPAKISIPDLFACMNAEEQYVNWNAEDYYHNVYTKSGGKAADCISCGKCEKVCPQKLPIRELLKDVSARFDKK